MGCIPGIITSVNDVEKLGRVKVRVDLIDPTTNLPNASDGYAWVGEEFVCNAQSGGAHRLLKEGTQCFLIPIMGKPTQWVLLACVNSRVDPPHPELDRAKELHGSVSPKDVYKINNDTDQSQVHAFPHGVTEMVTGGGDTIAQTAGGARTHLQQDGGARVENPFSFSTLTADGSVIQKSKEGAQTALNKDGTASFSSGFNAALKLLAQETKLAGPLDDLSQALNQAQKLLNGSLGQAQRMLQSLNTVVAQLNAGGDLEKAIVDADKFLGTLQQGIGTTLQPALTALSTIQGANPEQLGERLLPQVQDVIAQGIDKLAPKVEALLEQQLSTAALIQQLQPLTEKAIDTPEVRAIIEGLRFDPKLQLQAILDELLPKGFQSVQHLAGLELADKVGQIQNLLIQPLVLTPNDEPINNQQPATSNEVNDQALNDRVTQLQKLLPDYAQELVGFNDLKALVQPGADSSEKPLQQLLGQIQTGIVSTAKQQLEQAQPLVDAIAPIQSLVQAVRAGDADKILSQIGTLAQNSSFGSALSGIKPTDYAGLLNQTLSSLTNQLQPLLKEALPQLGQLSSAIPKDTGALLRLTNQVGEMTAKEVGKSAVMRVSALAAEMVDPSGKNSIFAGLGGAGLKTPFGKFSFGSLGGVLFGGGGQMAIATAAAGLFLNKTGVSLSSLNEAKLDENDQVIFTGENARIMTEGNAVKLQAIGSNGSTSEIQINPDGIFINGYEFGLLLSRLAVLEGQLAALSTLNTP